jgi:hypothetical protein
MICWEKVICSGQPSMSRCTISPLSAESLTRDYSKRLGGPSWPLVRTDRRLQYGEIDMCYVSRVPLCPPCVQVPARAWIFDERFVYKSQLVHGSLTKDSCATLILVEAGILWYTPVLQDFILFGNRTHDYKLQITPILRLIILSGNCLSHLSKAFEKSG